MPLPSSSNVAQNQKMKRTKSPPPQVPLKIILRVFLRSLRSRARSARAFRLSLARRMASSISAKEEIFPSFFICSTAADTKIKQRNIQL